MAKLYFRYGTMNSGKSIEVLRVAHNYEEQGKKVLLFTPSIDSRYGVGHVTSRIGIQKEAVVVKDGTDMAAMTREHMPDCVMVDEAQFLTEPQVIQLTDIADDLDIPVLAYGLRADFMGKLFPGSEALFSWADKIEEIKTICWYCNRKATMNMRYKDGIPVFAGEQIQIGGNESYLPVCRRCYKEARERFSPK
ncbi:thymidine kinase [Paenibacillus thermotolerans]|uniref:thymidine kinase n=1 Tax=Paenibacillus thermotolerans TaxID=3027807 RepID=UPI002368028D|nr:MULTISPECIES: thymidine kinase [unclassified Paenibacillus]